MKLTPAILCLSLLSGCDAIGGAIVPGPGQGSDVELVEYADEGLVCLAEDGDAVVASVQFEDCLGCGARDVVTSCSLELDGDTLILVSDGSYVYEEPDGDCTMSCRPFVAECASPPIAAGSFTVQHGDQTFTIEVPGDVEGCYAAE